MHCAGAMIVLEHEDRPNQIMRIAERLGFYDRTALVMDSPVPETPDEWVDLPGEHPYAKAGPAGVAYQHPHGRNWNWPGREQKKTPRIRRF
jgi:hypothetical protein